MPALHWICALTLTLALVCSLSAQPVKRSIAGRKQLDRVLADFKVNKTKCPETRLYSPTNIHVDCLSSALNCTIMELTVLEAECQENFLILKTGLSRQWKITSNSTQDCRCELYEKTDVEQFVNNLKSLVQQLNVLTA